MTILFIYVLVFAIAFLLLTSYVLYPLLLYILPARLPGTLEFPDSTVIHVIVPCYNEERVLEKKVENALATDYPFPVKVHVAIDKSTDRTHDIARGLAKKHANVLVWDKGYRKGKNDSINYVIQQACPREDDILLFTDANTFFEKGSFMALYEELRKGSAVVGGSMVYLDMETQSARSEGLYWKYEEWIRGNESRLGRLIAMNGGIMTMVAKHFKPVPADVPNDFEAPLRLVSTRRSTFAKEARGLEEAILDEKEEYHRKERMANRQMNAVLSTWNRMSAMTKFQVTFHKVVRWFGLHLFLLQSGLVLLALVLAPDRVSISLVLIHGLILILMGAALAGAGRIESRFLSLAYHAMVVHHSAFKGAFGSLLGKEISTWKKAESNRGTPPA